MARGEGSWDWTWGQSAVQALLEFGGDINRIAAGRYGWKVRAIAGLARDRHSTSSG